MEIISDEDPIDGHDVFDQRLVLLYHDDVAGVARVGCEVVLGAVATVEDVSEAEGRGGGSGAENWACAEVEDLVQGDQAVERVEPRVDLGGVGVFFDLEEDHVLDCLSLGGHLDRVKIWDGKEFGR